MEEQIKTETEQQEQWHHVVTVEELGGLKRKVGVTYDAVAVKMAFDKATQGVGKRALINGFRRGKAPRGLVERFCAKEIEVAASTMLAQEGYMHAVYEHKLAALSEPKVESPKFNTDGTFSCEIIVEVRPTIMPSGYIGLHLPKPPVDLTQIASTIMGNLRDRFAKFEEREVVGVGMTVVVDYSVSVEGKEVMTHQGVPFAVSENGQLPLGAVQTIGLNVDSQVSSRLTLPVDFQDHGGKEADVLVTVKKILESVPPTDEELAIRNGLKSTEELMLTVQQQANMEAGQQARQFLEAQVVDLLLSAHEFEVPEEWIKRESQYLVKQLGITGEMDESTKNAVRDMSEQNVKRSFMLDAIYDAEPTLRVKGEEVEALLDQEAAKQAVPKTQLKRMLIKQGMMDSVIELVKGKKIMDFLISNAEVATQGAQVVPQEKKENEDGGQEDPNPASTGI
jgi:trigger factor